MMYEEKVLMWQMERKEIQQTIELLKKEMQTMREELSTSMFQKDKCEKQNTPSKAQVMEYHADEKELRRETEWILKKNKQRRINASPEMSSRQQKLEQTEQTKQSNVQNSKTSANNS
jgi:hypothetical protein